MFDKHSITILNILEARSITQTLLNNILTGEKPSCKHSANLASLNNVSTDTGRQRAEFDCKAMHTDRLNSEYKVIVSSRLLARLQFNMIQTLVGVSCIRR